MLKNGVELLCLSTLAEVDIEYAEGNRHSPLNRTYIVVFTNPLLRFQHIVQPGHKEQTQTPESLFVVF